MIKKYVFKHPELSRYFPENKSTFHLTSWAALNQNALGSGYVHDDKLTNKRWEISSEIINEENTSHGIFHSIVLFHTPTHFVIEYLRVDIDSPISKRITIIDGRKDMKEWIDEIPEDKINKRVYSKYRPDDKYKY
jgi:hypothetical protein